MRGCRVIEHPLTQWMNDGRPSWETSSGLWESEGRKNPTTTIRVEIQRRALTERQLREARKTWGNTGIQPLNKPVWLPIFQESPRSLLELVLQQLTEVLFHIVYLFYKNLNPLYLWSLCTSSATRESQIPGYVSSARKMASCSSSAASGLWLLFPPFSFNYKINRRGNSLPLNPVWHVCAL